MSAKGQKRTDQSNGDYGFLSESGHRRRDARGQLRAAVLALASTAAAGAAGIRRAEFARCQQLFSIRYCGADSSTRHPRASIKERIWLEMSGQAIPVLGEVCTLIRDRTSRVGWRNRPATTKRPQISFSRGPLLNASPRGVSPSRAAEEHPDRTPRDRGVRLSGLKIFDPAMSLIRDRRFSAVPRHRPSTYL